MNKDFIKKMTDYIDDPEIKNTIDRISDNFDRVERMTQQRRQPDGHKTRAQDLMTSLDPAYLTTMDKYTGQLGLVLSGGGAKGSYQVGVCKALEELGILAHPEAGTLQTGLHISGLAGTSAGALNAALFAGGDALLAQSVWSSLEKARIQGQDGFFGPSDDNDRYLEDMIRKCGVLSKITPESLPALVTAFDYDRAYPKDFLLNTMSEEDKVRSLLASAAFPFAFKERVIQGIKYIDGGVPLFGSNIPVAPLYYLGFRKFIVIHCYSKAEGLGFAFLDKLNLKVNQEEYFNGSILVHIYPSRNLGGIFEGTLNFDHDYIMKNIELGYNDMYKAVKDLSILSEDIGDYDEVHMVNGTRLRSFSDVLDHK